MSTTEIPQEIKDNIEKAINDGRTSQGTHPKIWAYYGYSLSQPLQQERDELRKEVERLKQVAIKQFQEWYLERNPNTYNSSLAKETEQFKQQNQL